MLHNRKQQLFNICASHLIRQRERSANEDMTCLYRGSNGLKCAAGILIPDEKYHRGLEGFVLPHGPIAFHAGYGNMVSLMAAMNITLEEAVFVYKLQDIHDYGDVVVWPSRLRELANNHHLDMVHVPDDWAPITRR